MSVFKMFLLITSLLFTFFVQGSLAGCVDLSSFNLNGVVTNCYDAITEYGVYGVCESPSLMDTCCESCQPVSVKNDKLFAEGFFVIDAKAKELYLREEGNDDKKATERLIEDAKFLITDANFFYDTLLVYGLDIDIKIAAVQVLSGDLASGSEIQSGDVVNEDVMINNFDKFLQSNDADLKDDEYDFAILFTGYDLPDPTAGYARLGTMCYKGHAYGVVEMRGIMVDSSVLAHEIGHIFGAEHDPDDQVTVMSPSYKPSPDPAQYRFSSLSADYISTYLGQSVRSSDCLYSTSSSSETPSVTPEKYEGNAQDPTYICERYVGVGSTPCTGNDYYGGDLTGDSLCAGLQCIEVNDKPGICSALRPSEGMACDKGKSCRKGYCLTDTRPERQDVNENCVLGDSASFALNGESYTCSRALSDFGMATICGDENLLSLCCESCADYDASGCYDEVTFVLNRQSTTCDEAVKDYGKSTVCGSLGDTCCATCNA